MAKLIEGEGMEAQNPEQASVPAESAPVENMDFMADAKNSFYDVVKGKFGESFRVKRRDILAELLWNHCLVKPQIDGHERVLMYDLRTKIPLELGQEWLVEYAGEYALQMNIGQEAVVTNLPSLGKLIPDVGEVVQTLGVAKAHASQYTLVLTLPPEEKAFALLALQERKFPKTAWDFETCGKYVLKEAIKYQWTPPTPQLVKIAEKYQVTDISGVLSAIEHRHKWFEAEWKL